MIDLMLSTLAPHICSGCSEYGAILCKSCSNDIECEDFGRCVWCLRPTANMHQCTSCQRQIGAHGAWVVGERTEVLQRLINDYKFESRREAATHLAQLLDATLPSLPDNTIITWVPTAHPHIRARGFDHAALLARRFAKLRRLQARPLLMRHHSRSQHELGRTEREKAAKQAFSLLAQKDLSDSPILLIDDVLTTGATLRACVGLLGGSCAEVYVAVVGRQPL